MRSAVRSVTFLVIPAFFFFAGLSSNRFYEETQPNSTTAAFADIHPSDSSADWLGVGQGLEHSSHVAATGLDHDTLYKTAFQEGVASVLSSSDRPQLDQFTDTDLGHTEIKMKRTQHQLVRDLKMEEVEKKFGEAFFQRSVSYSGTNHRLRRVLRKAINGGPLNVGVIGGSITFGSHSPKKAEMNYVYHCYLTKWLKETFPDNEVNVHNMGMSGTGTSYWSTCWQEQMRDDLDIYIVDFAINDERIDDHHRTYDIFLRSVLLLPHAPAVINLEFPSVSHSFQLSGAGSYHLDSSRFFDVPSLSLRNPLLPELLLHPKRIPQWYARNADGSPDPKHPGLMGHYVAGNILIHYIWKQILHVEAHNSPADVAREKLAVSKIGTVDEEKEGVYNPFFAPSKEIQDAWHEDLVSWMDETDFGTHDEDLELVPRLSLLDTFHPSRFIGQAHSSCRNLRGSRVRLEMDATTPGIKTVDGEVLSGTPGEGWFQWEFDERRKYFVSRDIDAKVTFKVNFTLGIVKLGYLKSKIFGLGSVRCWVDDHEDVSVVFDGPWGYDMNVENVNPVPVPDNIEPGDHLLHCVNLGKGEFRIISLITA